MPSKTRKSMIVVDDEEDELYAPPDISMMDPVTKAKVIARYAELFKDSILTEAYKKRDQVAKQLVQRVLDGSDPAMKELLERTLGKVKEDFNITAKVEHAVSVPEDRFNQIIQVRARRIENGKPSPEPATE